MKEVRKRLEEHLAELERRLQKIERDRRRESNTLDIDWEEQATTRQNDEVLDGLDEEVTQQAESIRAALKRMDEGTYGVCSSCGGKIGKARLEALPQAVLCIECAEKEEKGGAEAVGTGSF